MQIEKFEDREFEKTQEAKDNIKFIKLLMQDKNKEIFENMSSVTITNILFNKLLTYDDFKENLTAVKIDNVCGELENERQEALQDYLLGGDYKRLKDIKAFDEKTEKNSNIYPFWLN